MLGRRKDLELVAGPKDAQPAGCSSFMPCHCDRNSAFMLDTSRSMKAEFLTQWDGMQVVQLAEGGEAHG